MLIQTQIVMQVNEILTPPGVELPKNPKTNTVPEPPPETVLTPTTDSAETVSSVPLGETPSQPPGQDQTAETVSGVPLGESGAQPSEPMGTVYLPEPPPQTNSEPHPKGCRCAQCPPWTGKQGRHPNGCRCGRCKQSSRSSGEGARADFSDLNQGGQNAVDYKAQAEMLFDLATNTLGGLVGPEWLPVKPEPGRPGERDLVCAPLAKYLESKGMVDLPPGYMVCFMCALYSLPRLREENTQSVIKKTWKSLCDLWYWLKGKFS